MAVAIEVIYWIVGIGVVLFFVFFSMLRMSNSIVSKKLSESEQRIKHLEKIAKHHSKILTMENMKLRHRLSEIEKQVEKTQQKEQTEQLIEKAIEKINKKH